MGCSCAELIYLVPTCATQIYVGPGSSIALCAAQYLQVAYGIARVSSELMDSTTRTQGEPFGRQP